MYIKKFSCNEITILVRTNSKEVLESLSYKYGNYYNDLENPKIYTIDYIVDKSFDIEKKYSDCEYKDKTQNYIFGDEKSLKVYLPYYDKYKEQFVKRIFTTTFLKLFEKNGYIILHGACVKKNNIGVLISGNKGKGKTTLLTKLLMAGYDYVANDRLVAKAIGNEIVVCGIPFSMGISKKDIEEKYHIDTLKFNYIEEVGKVFLENSEVSDIFGVNVKNKANLSCLLLCDYDLSFEGIKSFRIENCISKLGNNIMGKESIPSQKYYLHDIIKTQYVDSEFLNKANSWEFIQGKTTQDNLVSEVQRLSLCKK